MKLTVGVLLLMAGLVLSSSDKPSSQDKAKCLGTCNNKCTTSYNACMKDAKTKNAITSCEKSKSLCGSVCINKACI